MPTVGQILIAAVLLAAAGTKLAAPASHRRFVVFGVTGPRAQWLAWGSLTIVEAALAVAILVGVDVALLVAAVQFAGFALLHGQSIRRGAAGQACGCFGTRGTVSWGAVLQNGALAGVAALTYAGARGSLTERTALIVAVTVIGVVVVVLSAAVLALAREVGVLRLAMQSTGALEIADEGPELGTHVDLSAWGDAEGHEFVLAVFVSAGCPMCRNLGPSLELLARDPRLAVITFDEERDQHAWSAFRSPGAPYAVALGADGVVLAKGVTNSLPQLESVIATAVRRRKEPIDV